MAHHLKMAMIQAIVTLHQRGWSNRRIARELGLDRQSVARQVALARSNAARRGPNPPPGSGPVAAGGADSKPATPEANPPPGKSADGAGVYDASEVAAVDSKPASNPPPGSAGTSGRLEPASPAAAALILTGPASTCEPYRAIIEEKLAAGLSGQRIYQDLKTQHGDAAPSYESIKRFLRRLCKLAEIPFRRMESPPGQEAQVDFGTGAPVVGADGKRRRTHVFRIVLSYSRKAYSEAVYHQSTEEFIACLENALAYFNGVPRTLVIDNLRAAVKYPDWYDPELVPRLEAFCRHYGTVILPTKAYTPRHKGKVERGVAYVQDNGLKGHQFSSLAAENQHLRQWEQAVADTRIHGTTRRQVGRVFAEIEKAALLPLPQGRFPFFHEALRTVHRDGHVAVAQAYYSVPPEYVGRQVWVRWDSHLVKLFNTQRHEPIAVHARQEAGRFATDQAHLHVHKTTQVERGASYLLQQAARLGDDAAAWSQAMLQTRGVEGLRVLVGLLALAKRYPDRDINTACRVAASHQSYRLRAIRELLTYPESCGAQASFELTQEHPIIRTLGEYDALVHAALRGTEE